MSIIEKVNDKLPLDMFQIAKRTNVGTVVISTTIQKGLHNFVREKQMQEDGWGWSELLRAGIRAKCNPSNYEEKLVELSKQIEVLKRARDAQRMGGFRR